MAFNTSIGEEAAAPPPPPTTLSPPPSPNAAAAAAASPNAAAAAATHAQPKPPSPQPEPESHTATLSLDERLERRSLGPGTGGGRKGSTVKVELSPLEKRALEIFERCSKRTFGGRRFSVTNSVNMYRKTSQLDLFADKIFGEKRSSAVDAMGERIIGGDAQRENLLPEIKQATRRLDPLRDEAAEFSRDSWLEWVRTRDPDEMVVLLDLLERAMPSKQDTPAQPGVRSSIAALFGWE